MKSRFSKRIFTAKSFIAELAFVIWHLPKIIYIFVSKKSPKHLLEKIVIVTDAVNGCIYCSWMDAKLAIKNGMSEDEVNGMLNLQFHTHVTDYDRVALLFAQHYAETSGHPDKEMAEKLNQVYGDKTASNIMLAIKAVTFGNMYFNTWLAAISRFQGRPAPNSSIVFEVAYILINFIIIVPVMILRKLDRNAIGISPG